MEVNVIFGTSLIEGTTAKEMAIYVNEARRDDYRAILTSPHSITRKAYLLLGDRCLRHALFAQ